MKILTRQQQQAILDFVCEQYAVALRSYKRGVLKINTFAVIQTQAYNAAAAVAGSRGIQTLRARQADIEANTEQRDREGGQDEM